MAARAAAVRVGAAPAAGERAARPTAPVIGLEMGTAPPPGEPGVQPEPTPRPMRPRRICRRIRCRWMGTPASTPARRAAPATHVPRARFARALRGADQPQQLPAQSVRGEPAVLRLRLRHPLRASRISACARCATGWWRASTGACSRQAPAGRRHHIWPRQPHGWSRQTQRADPWAWSQMQPREVPGAASWYTQHSPSFTQALALPGGLTAIAEFARHHSRQQRRATAVSARSAAGTAAAGTAAAGTAAAGTAHPAGGRRAVGASAARRLLLRGASRQQRHHERHPPGSHGYLRPGYTPAGARRLPETPGRGRCRVKPTHRKLPPSDDSEGGHHLHAGDELCGELAPGAPNTKPSSGRVR